MFSNVRQIFLIWKIFRINNWYKLVNKTIHCQTGPPDNILIPTQMRSVVVKTLFTSCMSPSVCPRLTAHAFPFSWAALPRVTLNVLVGQMSREGRVVEYYLWFFSVFNYFFLFSLFYVVLLDYLWCFWNLLLHNPAWILHETRVSEGTDERVRMLVVWQQALKSSRHHRTEGKRSDL